MISMDKKIEDYLNLYIGTECAYDPARKVLGEPEPIFPIYWSNLEYVFNGIMDGKFKLAVRPLSDMTEEERYECELEMYEGNQDVIGVSTMNEFLPPWNDNERPGFEPTVKMINWLRRNGFDCDNLIESGLAIDKTTLPQPK